ncbi:hypothetical protein BCR43DRAFT_527023 [Syncephalastrum racemosum]|uniref:Extracellular membrane protein CFEM domain-containing protein n=1 Tax=Syncephalastrum racemosum TaxID=13706 RepID=A0A1X2H516_SYNRA|nr:hypothetical protein BCR43DRAFT_527023 [Syncephalastrum racemosum]
MKSFHLAVGTLVSVMVSITAAQTTVATCADQTVFDQCKKNEQNYLDTCTNNDFACLCKWQTAMVSCWNSCPDDQEKGTQQALQTTYCSQPGANVTTVASSSAALPSSSMLPSASVSSGASSASASASSSSNPSSGAASAMDKHSLFAAAALTVASSAYYYMI